MEVHARPCGMLEVDGGIETAARQQEGVHALGDMHRDAWMPILEMLEPGDQPAGGEGRDGGDIDAGAFDGLSHQIQAVAFQPIQRLANLRRVSQAVGREPHPVADALEQRDAQKCLQSADLPTHGALGTRQFLGRAGEAAVAGRGLEGQQRGVAGDPASHGKLSRRNVIDSRLSKYH